MKTYLFGALPRERSADPPSPVSRTGPYLCCVEVQMKVDKPVIKPKPDFFLFQQAKNHLQTQIQAVPVLSSLYSSLISFSSLTFPGAH